MSDRTTPADFNADDDQLQEDVTRSRSYRVYGTSGRDIVDEDILDAWSISDQRRGTIRIFFAGVAIVIVLLALVFVALIVVADNSDNVDFLFATSWEDVWALYAALAAAILSLVPIVYVPVINEMRRRFETAYRLQRIAESQLSLKDVTDYRSLWISNSEQMQEYHRIVTNYASRSRQTTLLSLIAGFIFVATLSLIAINSSGTASISAAIIGALGTALTGFVANATLKNSAESAAELRAFFLHPLTVQNALAAERLCSQIPDGNQIADARSAEVSKIITFLLTKPDLGPAPEVPEASASTSQ